MLKEFGLKLCLFFNSDTVKFSIKLPRYNVVYGRGFKTPQKCQHIISLLPVTFDFTNKDSLVAHKNTYFIAASWDACPLIMFVMITMLNYLNFMLVIFYASPSKLGVEVMASSRPSGHPSVHILISGA